MTAEFSAEELLFEAKTPLGFKVRVTQAYWQIIVTIKHPVMAGREAFVKDTLENPDEIRQSKADERVFLFYKTERPMRWVCVVSRKMDGEGFVITTYPTDAIKEGVRIWPR